MLGDSPSFVILLATIFPFTSRQDAFYYYTAFGLGIFIRCCMKMAFRDPRPFMQTLLVYPNMCDFSYGTPDSEILLTTLMIGVIFLNKGQRAIYSCENTFTKSISKFCWFLAVFIWVNILVCGVVSGLCTID